MNAKVTNITANLEYGPNGSVSAKSHDYEILFENGVTVKFTGLSKNIITGMEPIEECVYLLKQIVDGN